jgi:hypothetical protein
MAPPKQIDTLSAIVESLENSSLPLYKATVQAGKLIWNAYCDGTLTNDQVWNFIVQEELGTEGRLFDGDDGFASLAYYSICRLVPLMVPGFTGEPGISADDPTKEEAYWQKWYTTGLMQLAVRLRRLERHNAAKMPGPSIPTFDADKGVVFFKSKAISLGQEETDVLKVLVIDRAVTLRTLRNRSGCETANKVLASLRKKYPCLKTHITLPGHKGAGGYRTTIDPIA